MELATFLVQRVIIHQIPKVNKQDKAETGPVIADLETPLTDALRRYFRERITTSLGKKHFDAVYAPPEEGADPTTISPVPQLVIELFRQDGVNFVEASQTMARHLFSLQTGSNSEGMLVLVEGTIGSGERAGRCVAILKLEMSGALAIREHRDSAGVRFDAEVREITLQRDAHVFKAAIFDRAHTLASLAPVVSDDQRDPKLHGSEIATFFLRFIGCKLRDTPERATKTYLEKVEQFVNTQVPEEELRKRLMLHVISELGGNTSEIDPSEVASRYLPVELQDGFVGMFRHPDGSVPVVPKDDTLVRARIRTVVAEFSGDIRLSGPALAMDEALQPTGDGAWKIVAPLKHIGPR